MNLDSLTETNIKEMCHISSNEDGDCFVGIKADSDNAMIYFPLGYDLPESDNEIRQDIKHLIEILVEFTTPEDRVLALNKFAAPQSVNFPITAYRNVIEYYFSVGGNYYIETDPEYKTGQQGNKDWSRTVRNKKPLVQTTNGISSFIFTDYIVRSSTPNSNKYITTLNKYCVYEAFDKLGWLYVPYKPDKIEEKIDHRRAISFLSGKIQNTNDDKKKSLFTSMLNMILYMDEKTNDKQFYFGTDRFEYVWEKIVDRAYGEKNKDMYFPKTRWQLKYGKDKGIEKYPLQPDTIMIYNDKYYVLDSKYYRYGWTGRYEHLPDSSSISKQITYGEFLEQKKKCKNEELFNAFIMPYNMHKNYFQRSDRILNIGEALSSWKNNDKNYERVQGIVIDTRYLLYHYNGSTNKDKAEIAKCIEQR